MCMWLFDHWKCPMIVRSLTESILRACSELLLLSAQMCRKSVCVGGQLLEVFYVRYSVALSMNELLWVPKEMGS